MRRYTTIYTFFWWSYWHFRGSSYLIIILLKRNIFLKFQKYSLLPFYRIPFFECSLWKRTFGDIIWQKEHIKSKNSQFILKKIWKLLWEIQSIFIFWLFVILRILAKFYSIFSTVEIFTENLFQWNFNRKLLKKTFFSLSYSLFWGKSQLKFSIKRSSNDPFIIQSFEKSQMILWECTQFIESISWCTI